MEVYSSLIGKILMLTGTLFVFYGHVYGIPDKLSAVAQSSNVVTFRQNSVVDEGSRPCPCFEAKLCQRVLESPQQEVFAFSISNKNWRKYDWTKVTTVVEVGYHDDKLMCHAHSQGVRVVQMSNLPTSQLINKTARHIWVQERLKDVTTNFLDGVNVDYESEIDLNMTAYRQGLTELVRELKTALKSLGMETQVTVDFAWSPDCIDSRCYDYKSIADIADFVFVMAYDERSQITGACVAWANSAYNNTEHGLKRFLTLGVPSEKLVLGIPWYGYKYQCQHYDKTDHRCDIKHVPFRGVSCSDAAGSQISYSGIVTDYLPHSFTGRMWDETSQSPFFGYKAPDTGVTYQFWYDDVTSLLAKYAMATSLGLRGVGMWEADLIDYNNKGQVTDMWGALPGRT